MKLSFTSGENDPKTINIKGKCTITSSDKEAENSENLIVNVDGKKVSVMLGENEQDNLTDIKLNDTKFSIFTTIAGLDGNPENLTKKDIALAKKHYKNGSEIWNSLQENGVTEIRYDSHAGVATIAIGENNFLRIDFETRIEKIKKFFGIGTDKTEDKPQDTKPELPTSTKEDKKPEYKSYDKFFTALAKKESTSNPTTINESGFAGLYQIGEEAFASLGIYTEEGENAYKKNDWCGKFTGKYGINSLDDFLNNEKIQKKVLADLMKYNWKQIKRLQLDKDFLGRKINGQTITESGLIAAAHLGGVGSLEDYLRDNYNHRDKNNTSIAGYIRRFAFYNMKEITGEDPVTKPRPIPPKTVEEEVCYTIKSGDNLSKIAAKYNTTVKEIMATNQLKNNKLRIGQKLTIFVPKDY